MKTGTLVFRPLINRMDVKFNDGEWYGGLHCGTCMDIKLNGKWIPTRIEYGNDWYLVDTKLRGEDQLTGITVRL